ncbi:MAG: DUF6444 domain-containing protein, partial [Candidatus Adiutrix sp.]|nr:DUF6444 domain-containing protein [Candidatus Adiutrix sp.]
MTLKDFDPQQLMQSARQQIADEPNLSSALKTTIELLITLCLLLLERLPKNSKNSSLPPSQDPNRTKQPKAKNIRRPGGQPGRLGRTLKAVPDPDRVELLEVDHRKLPPGRWRDSGRFISRQVFDITVKTYVTEYRAQIMVNDQGLEV